MRFFLFLITSFFFCITSEAQVHTPLYPNLADNDLLVAIQENYKPDTVLSYGQARDTMFSKIYNINDSLECVYTGYKIYLDPTEDPTDAAYMNGIATGINTEHTYPRSKGAESGNPKSDMHHLYATRTPVNGDRGSLPFADVNDASTLEWYRLGSSQSNIPSSSIRDEFSELGSGAFEPREVHKGNVARAMMYFYTMYRQEADNAAPGYFEGQRETFLRWHQEDPVDALEYERTWQIADYQSGKPNPFVLDTLLAYRIYCVNDLGVCDYTTSTASTDLNKNQLGQNYPNPMIHQSTTIPYELNGNFHVKLSVFDWLGREVMTLVDEQQTAGKHEVDFSMESLNTRGIFQYRLLLQNGSEQHLMTKSMVVW